MVALRSGFRFVSIRTPLLEKCSTFLYHFHPVIKFYARAAGFLPAYFISRLKVTFVPFKVEARFVC